MWLTSDRGPAPTSGKSRPRAFVFSAKLYLMASDWEGPGVKRGWKIPELNGGVVRWENHLEMDINESMVDFPLLCLITEGYLTKNDQTHASLQVNKHLAQLSLLTCFRLVVSLGSGFSHQSRQSQHCCISRYQHDM